MGFTYMLGRSWNTLVGVRKVPRFSYARTIQKTKHNNTLYFLPMEKKYKLNYDPPRVTMVSFVVEEGLQMSVRTDGFELPLFDNKN